MYDITKVRQDFPIFATKINGKPNVFLDTAASAQKPKQVIDKISSVYGNYYANVHRGSYYLSEKITQEYEDSRKIVQEFIGAKTSDEIVWTRSATEAINLVASTWGIKNIKAGDEILLSEAEHHANLVPWQVLRDKTGCVLRFFELDANGSFDEQKYLSCLNSNTKLVAVTAMSNVLGSILPIKKIINHAHSVGAICLVDACQFVAHAKIDVQDIDCDFLVFSGHKLYGPTGIGVLYGKYNILESMPPYQTGGDMVDKVGYQKTSYALPPARFEAGTPAIVQAIALGEAINYLQNLGMDSIFAYKQELKEYTQNKLSDIKELKIIGNCANKGGIFSFALGGIHPQDLTFIIQKEGVAIRTGHFCAEPLVNKLGYASLARASIGLYSTKEDIDIFVATLQKAQTFFRG